MLIEKINKTVKIEKFFFNFDQQPNIFFREFKIEILEIFSNSI